MLADELLEGLVNTVAGGYAVGEIDVAVLGYRTGEDGLPQLFSLLPDGDAKPRFVPLATGGRDAGRARARPRASRGSGPCSRRAPASRPRSPRWRRCTRWSRCG